MHTGNHRHRRGDRLPMVWRQSAGVVLDFSRIDNDRINFHEVNMVKCCKCNFVNPGNIVLNHGTPSNICKSCADMMKIPYWLNGEYVSHKKDMAMIDGRLVYTGARHAVTREVWNKGKKKEKTLW